MEFFAPWCPYCKRFAPIYKQVAAEVQKKTDRIKFARVDITKEKVLTRRYNIRGYPTTILFHNGKEMKFGRLMGARTADTVKRWLKYKTKVQEMLSIEIQDEQLMYVV